MRTLIASPDPSHERLLSPAHLAVRFGLHCESVRRMIRQGRLPAIRLGKRLRVKMADVEAYEASNRIQARKEGR